MAGYQEKLLRFQRRLNKIMYKYIIYHHGNKVFESMNYLNKEEAMSNGYSHLDAVEVIDEKYYTIDFKEVDS